jgi:hypothetical protein
MEIGVTDLAIVRAVAFVFVLEVQPADGWSVSGRVATKTRPGERP